MNALDMWGIAEIGDTFIYFRILTFMSSYITIHACFDATLTLASAGKRAITFSAKLDSCGPLMTATWISSLAQLWPILTGHPPVAYFSSVSYVEWWTANPDGDVLFWCLPGGGSSAGKKIYLRELTNLTVIPAPPDGCGVLADSTCATHY